MPAGYEGLTKREAVFGKQDAIGMAIERGNVNAVLLRSGVRG